MDRGQQARGSCKESVTCTVTGKLTKERILDGLPTRIFGQTLFFFEEIDSTNACAKTLADTGAADGTVVWAEHQTAGRGRHGRSWTDTPGDNLMFTVVVREVSDRHLPWVPYYMSEAVAGGIERALDIRLNAKWPNDLLMNDKKVCGMLLEGSDNPAGRFVVAGIGINVNQMIFPPEILHSATSLQMELGREVDRIPLFHSILENMEALLHEIRSHGGTAVLESWTNRCSTFGNRITLRTGSGTVNGTALGLSKDGGLLLRTDDGLRTFYEGDVTISGSFPRTTTA